MPGDERTQETVERSPGLLVTGELDLLGLMPNASNYTFLARCSRGDEQMLVVYKPGAGEAPLWDFPEHTLHLREVAAWEVADVLGWPSVPDTVLREGPHGPGSVQAFIDFDPEQHYFTLREQRLEEFRRVALFDALINNADRKGGHCLVDGAGKIWLIDHGVSFNVEPKLRTVVWDFAGEPIADAELEDLQRFSTDTPTLRMRLGGLLAEMELDALFARLDELLATQRYPEPGKDRHYPWPPL
jgi:uncharacterized repeat protein (TIGR03843 family)